jgi:hypothetical protein
MITKTRWEILLAMVGVASFGVAWHEARSAHTTGIAVAAAIERKASLEGRSLRAAEQKTTAERERVQLQIVLDGLQAPRKKTPALPPGVVELIAPAVASAQLEVHKMPWRDIVLEKDPKLQALYLQTEPARLAARYAQFVQARGLVPGQAGKFQDLMMENAERVLDLKLTARTMGLAETDAAIVKLQQQAADQLRTAQTGLLGESGYQQLQQYERAAPVRDFVGTLAGSLAFTETPLSARQAEQLVQIMVTANPGYQNGGNADPPLLGEMFDSLMMAGKTAPVIDSDTVLKQARSILSEAQYSQFEARINGNQNLVQLFNLILKAPGDPMVGFVFGRR